MHRSPRRRRLLFAQALYYIVTGLWPLVSMATFEAATGPKIDDWLVRMVACLIIVIGATIGAAAVRGHVHAGEISVLAAGSAAAFIAIDGWYAAIGRISVIYLADAVVEIALLAGLWLTRRRYRTVHRHHPPPYIVDPAHARAHPSALSLRDGPGRKRRRPLS